VEPKKGQWLIYQCVIPTVLNGVLGSAREYFDNFAPSVTHGFLRFDQNTILLFCPTALLDGGV
jgi:hypothetical protein